MWEEHRDWEIRTDWREEAYQREPKAVGSDALWVLDRSQPPSSGQMLELLYQMQERERGVVQRGHCRLHDSAGLGRAASGAQVLDEGMQS